MPAAAYAAPASPAQPAVTLGSVTVEHARHIQQNLATGSVDAEGSVEVRLRQQGSSQYATLYADSFHYDAATGQITASGIVRIVQNEGTFLGKDFQLNLHTRVASVHQAVLETDYFRMQGKEISTLPNGTIVLTSGTFTTCVHDHPDYHLKAAKLTLSPRRSVLTAKKVTFYAGPTRLITLPSYHLTLRGGNSASAPTPLPGYNSSDGIFVQVQRDLLVNQNRTLNMNARINFRHLPTGDLVFQQDVLSTLPGSPPPNVIQAGGSDPLRSTLGELYPPVYSNMALNDFNRQFEPRGVLYAMLQNRVPVYNRNVNNLVISRFPEVGMRFNNLLARLPFFKSGSSATLGSAETALQRIPGAPVLLNARIAMGVIQEIPDNTTAGRLALRLRAASQPFLLGRRISFRAGLSEWFNIYSTGTEYNILSPELELDYVPTSTSRFAATYRYLGDAGRTPFIFDRRDVRNNLTLLYQVGGPWAFGVLSYIDLDHSRAYDGEFAVLRNLDCMQIGLSYRLRSQQIGIIFNLLPPTSNRIRRMPIQQTPHT